MKKILAFFSLFFSISTLLCCALPVLITLIAGGAALSSMILAFPWLVSFSAHKDLLFFLTFVFLLLQSYFLRREASSCPLGSEEACKTAKSFSRIFFYVSFFIFSLGFFSAYILVHLLRYLDLG